MSILLAGINLTINLFYLYKIDIYAIDDALALLARLRERLTDPDVRKYAGGRP